MGGFYGSVQVRGDDRDPVRLATEALSRETGRKFFLGPSLNGWIGLYPDDSGQNPALGRDLARRLPVEVFALRVHDDDFFAYEYYRDGELVDAYDSSLVNDHDDPGAASFEPQPHPETFAQLVSDPARFDLLREQLLAQGSQRVEVATVLLETFAETLGIRNAVACYDDLAEGDEGDDIEGWDRFVHVPQRTRTSRRKGRASAASRTGTGRSVSGGSLLAERRISGSPATPRAFLCPAPDGQGFLAAVNRLPDVEGSPQCLEYYGPPWTSGPAPTPWAVDPQADSLVLSDSGRYLAVASTSAAGVSRLTLWDTVQDEVVATTSETTSAHWLGFASGDRAMAWVDSGQVDGPHGDSTGFRLVAVHDARLAAVHPSGERVAMIDGLHRFLVLDAITGQVARELPATFAADNAHRYLNAPGMDAAIRRQMNDLRKAVKKTNSPDDPRSVDEFIEQFERDYRARLVRMSVDAAIDASPPGGVFRMRFDASGERLFLGTCSGLHVYSWEEIAGSHGSLSNSIAAFDPAEIPGTMGAHVHDIELDPACDRVLFAGRRGCVHSMELPAGRSRIVLAPADDRQTIHRLALSRDRRTLALVIQPGAGLSNREAPGPVLQFWDYRTLHEGAS